MSEKKLREQTLKQNICILICDHSPCKYSYDCFIDSKCPSAKKTDSIISLFKEYVKGKELTFEKAREISVDVLGIDCVRKIGEENSIICYKIGQIQKATVLATISKVMEGL